MPRLYLIVGFLLAVWVYLIILIIVVWKKKTDIFHDQMEPKVAERRLKMLKTFLLVAVISLPVFIVGIRVSFGLYYGVYEPVSFIIGVVAFVAFGVFVIATVCSQVIFLKGRRKQAKGVPK